VARTRASVVAAVAAAWALGTLVAGVAAWWQAGRWPLGPAGVDLYVRVEEVVDGDTLVVARGDGIDVVRVLGIDTPETVHPDRPVECFGPEASRYVRSRLEGRRVRLELDRVPRDRYGRLLAHVHLDGRLLSDELLRLGYARLLVIPPNHRHGRALLRAELEARAAGRGLWGACPG